MLGYPGECHVDTMLRMAGFELEFVAWLRAETERRRRESHGSGGFPLGKTVVARVELGIGDDMATLRLGGGRVLVSTDMLLDGVHFDTKCHTMAQIGRKALACGLSDCAAMIVRPAAFLVSVALPSALGFSEVQDLYKGMLDLADEFEIFMVGGDTTCWNGGLTIDVAIVAEPYEENAPVTRHGAKVGDRVLVTGRLGGSILGRHMSFQPRVREAEQIGRALGPSLHAAIDITDGLSLDLWRICQASEVGGVLDEALLEAATSSDAVRASERDGRSPLDHVLADGEDFELLLAAAGTADVSGLDLLPIGSITPAGLSLRRRDGSLPSIIPRGFVH